MTKFLPIMRECFHLERFVIELNVKKALKIPDNIIFNLNNKGDYYCLAIIMNNVKVINKSLQTAQ
jgi:hypothetical protein